MTDNKPLNYRRLEESRDRWQETATRWRNEALPLMAQKLGLDPEHPNVKFLLRCYRDQHDTEDDPGEALQRLGQFAAEYDMLPGHVPPNPEHVDERVAAMLGPDYDGLGDAPGDTPDDDHGDD